MVARTKETEKKQREFVKACKSVQKRVMQRCKLRGVKEVIFWRTLGHLEENLVLSRPKEAKYL